MYTAIPRVFLRFCSCNDWCSGVWKSCIIVYGSPETSLHYIVCVCCAHVCGYVLVRIRGQLSGAIVLSILWVLGVEFGASGQVQVPKCLYLLTHFDNCWPTFDLCFD